MKGAIVVANKVNRSSTNVTSTPRKKFLPKRTQVEQRYIISILYKDVLLSPEPSEWYGHGGTISEIVSMLHLGVGSRETVKRVLVKCHQSEKEGIPLDLSRKVHKNPPRPLKLPVGSSYELLAADYLERGCSCKVTATMINCHL